MIITDAQRWAIAQFCGWEFRPCRGKEDDCDDKDCGRWLLVGPSGMAVAWSEDSKISLGPYLPDYDTDQALVGPMLLAMVKAGERPLLSMTFLSRTRICTSGQHVGTGDTMNEACCRTILQIIESGEKQKGGKR